MVRRSLLFTPGDRPEMLRKAPQSGADTLVFDLEDAVSPDRKAEAREAVRSVLSDPAFDPSAEVCVRVNPSPDEYETDLEAILGTDADDIRLDRVLLPKADSQTDVRDLANALGTYGVSVPVLALIESARESSPHRTSRPRRPPRRWSSVPRISRPTSVQSELVGAKKCCTHDNASSWLRPHTGVTRSIPGHGVRRRNPHRRGRRSRSNLGTTANWQSIPHRSIRSTRRLRPARNVSGRTPSSRPNGRPTRTIEAFSRSTAR